MNRIRWYGPSVVLAITVLLVMLAGPGIVRHLVWTKTDAQITLVKDGLKSNVSLAELSNAFKDVAKVVEPSVVHIQVSARARPSAARNRMEELWRRLDPRMQPDEDDSAPGDKSAPGNPGNKDDMDKYNVPQPYGNGSGWGYDRQGHIVTNNHVIDGADVITVRFSDESERTAKVVGVDPKTDVAVLKVEGGDLHPAGRAKAPVEQGEIVFAFGSPFRFEFSMSQGIVSAKGRHLRIVDSGQGYENFIQTDAAINPGNSGGPLTNIYGEVIGMNTAIASRTGSSNGLGFAIPVEMVSEVVDQIIKNGKVVRGYLGIYIEDLDPKMAKTFGFEGKGVLVANPIEGSPGAKGGLKRGDIITKVADKPVTTADALRMTVASFPPGTKLKFDLFRAGKPMTLDITIGELPEQLVSARNSPAEDAAASNDEEGTQTLRKLGIEQAQTMTQDLATKGRIKFAQGVLVRVVRPNSAAAAAGIVRGGIITDVNDKPVKNIKELSDELKKLDLSQGVRLSVSENGNLRYVLIELKEKP